MSDDLNRLNFIIDLIQNELNLGRSLEYARTNLKRGFPESEVESAVQLFRAQQSALASNQVTVLQDHPLSPSENWFGATSTSPRSHWSLLKDVLAYKKHWTPEMLESLDAASSTVVSNLAMPFGATECVRKGLVLGYVQSGKTANFSAVIAKAVDAGYKLIIVLAGIHNNLRFQTEKRLFRELCEPDLASVTNLTEVDENGDFKKTQTVKAERACGKTDGFSLAVLKKNGTVLRNLNSWLDGAKPETLAKCPTLIIDDESDHASVNTSKDDDDPTTINSLIRDIIRRFEHLTYVGYTATPFANVLIDARTEDDIYPRDFMISLPKPPSYFGAEELFGSDAMGVRGAKKSLPVIRAVSINEAAKFNSRRKASGFDDLGENLIEAVYSFILAGAIRIARGQHTDHITMLIHTSHLTDIQQKLFGLLRDFIEELKVQNRYEMDPTLKDDLEQLYNRDFLPVSKSTVFRAAKTFPFSGVQKNIQHFISRLELVLDNSNSAQDERLSFDRDSPLWGIVIGGNTLSRGLTIEGLTTSYYVRDAKGYDTLLQMGRWFGFRPDYVDVTRLFMPDVLQRKFFHLSTVEEEMRAEIRTMAENKERPIDVALRIRCHPNMSVTSNLKARHAKDTILTFSGTKLQARSITVQDKNILRDNLGAVLSLVRVMSESGIRSARSRFKEFASSPLFRNVPSELILKFISSYSFSPSNVKFSGELLRQYISDAVKNDELGSWSVAVMSNRDGIPLTLSNGETVYKVERSVLATNLSERDRDAVYLTALSPPEDELIDLDDLAPASIISVDDFLKGSSGERRNSSSLRQLQRPVSRGLLLLYPLENTGAASIQGSAQASEPDSIPISGKLTPLVCDCDVFGITIVFPTSRTVKGNYRYVVNGTV